MGSSTLSNTRAQNGGVNAAPWNLSVSNSTCARGRQVCETRGPAKLPAHDLLAACPDVTPGPRVRGVAGLCRWGCEDARAQDAQERFAVMHVHAAPTLHGVP